MARYAGALSGLLVFMDIVAAAVTVQRAAVSFQVLDEFAPLHDVERLRKFQFLLRDDVGRVAIRVVFPNIFQIQRQRVTDIFLYFSYLRPCVSTPGSSFSWPISWVLP